MQRQNYWSDQKWQLYIVTYYKVTQQSPREPFCLSCVISEKTCENRVLYDTNDLYVFQAFISVKWISLNKPFWLE